ncbi:hypothetical protein JXB01_04585 [Candidatus Micrarchaeota archaeon]|nr:hypothetical protein [Candidatus Micrarchaeota archaeon]
MRGVKMKKGQAAIETLTTVGIAVVFIIPILLFYFVTAGYSYENVEKYQADSTVKNLAHTMNLVFIEGENSSRTILLNLPSSTKSFGVNEGGEVFIRLELSSGIYETSYPLINNETESFEVTDRKGLVRFEVINSGAGVAGG